MIREHRDTLDRFFAEQRSMDSVGAILDPTLFNSSERRATEQILTPIYRAAQTFLETYDRQSASARQALAKVGDRPEVR
ncbi:hypothetical protein [Chenggangzhangella methanolivorans]|uniref:Uncharacterized protein n=1 Tax=Chenggangzhangella methanolivorans TaxID=1437009 RepID=A0A9E6R827_9HYPH|nr:hypothetical protein [Chenggangzhangella methanolivorans]QZN99758.1 hypothetical protein K6K41_24340 [Chenggangzhangella methanolivorans]